jgi:hypothetical protein
MASKSLRGEVKSLAVVESRRGITKRSAFALSAESSGGGTNPRKEPGPRETRREPFQATGSAPAAAPDDDELGAVQIGTVSTRTLIFQDRAV